jgi:DNA primase
VRYYDKGYLSDEDIAEVRERNPIEEVVAEYVVLREDGPGALTGVCPWAVALHEDGVVNRITVRPKFGTFHCYGCGDGGLVIDFIMRIERVDFVRAVELLAARVGFELIRDGG